MTVLIVVTSSIPLAPLAASGDTGFLSRFAVYAVLGILPILIIAATSFLKISVVLSILRSALGAPGIPPTIVLTALAAVLTLFIMAPVGTEMFSAVASTEAADAEGGQGLGIPEAKKLYNAASPPLIAFLKINTPETETRFFQDLAGTGGEEVGLRVLLPAFATAELVEAFLMGFLLFIPFLVIDLIVSVVLLSLGMHMISPMAVSLPLKLLLFVAVDGWHILVSGLVVSYGF
jgi:type III secretion protein R